MKLIFIQKEQLKTGTATNKKTGKPFKWTLWRYKDSTGRVGTSFDDFLLDSETEVDMQEETVEKDGNTYHNVKFSRPKVVPVTRQDIEDIWLAIEELRADNKHLRSGIPQALEAVRQKNEGETIPF